MLQDGYVGLLCVADGGWCAYAWMRRPKWPGTATPAKERASARCVLDHLLSDPALIPERGLFQAALRQLVAVAAAENEEADVYVDADAKNETSHRGIVASGFAAVGVIDALTAAVPKVGRIVVGELRLDAMPDTRANDLGLSAPSAAEIEPAPQSRLAAWAYRLIGPLLTGRFGRGVLVLSGGTAASQALIVLASPLLTRAYTPADFGVYGAALSLITFLTVASSLRYERAIPLPEDETVAVSLVALCLLLVATTTSAAAVVLFVAGPQITAFLHAPTLEPLLWVVLVAQAGAGTYQVMNGWAVRARAYSEIARTRLSQSVATLAVQLGMGGLGLNEQGLVVGDAIGRSVGTGRLSLRLWRTNSAAIRTITVSGIRSAMIRYRKFGLLVAPASLLNSISLQIPSVMLLALYGPEVAGWHPRPADRRHPGVPRLGVGRPGVPRRGGACGSQRAVSIARTVRADLAQLIGDRDRADAPPCGRRTIRNADHIRGSLAGGRTVSAHPRPDAPPAVHDRAGHGDPRRARATRPGHHRRAHSRGAHGRHLAGRRAVRTAAGCNAGAHQRRGLCELPDVLCRLASSDLAAGDHGALISHAASGLGSRCVG